MYICIYLYALATAYACCVEREAGRESWREEMHVSTAKS